MPRVEVTLPDRIDAQLENLVNQQDEFVSRDEAAEELLEMGLRAHDTGSSTDRDDLDTDPMRDTEDPVVGPGEYEDTRGNGPQRR